MLATPSYEGHGLLNVQALKFKDCNLLISNRKVHNRLVNSHNVVYIEGENNYSHIHLNTSEVHKTSKTLKWYDNKLKDYGFFRSKSFLINRSYIKEIGNGRIRCVYMTTGACLPISHKKMDELLKIIELDNNQNTRRTFKQWLQNVFHRWKRF
jgi:DNA-binding LytR/AlgR family response regulator